MFFFSKSIKQHLFFLNKKQACEVFAWIWSSAFLGDFLKKRPKKTFRPAFRLQESNLIGCSKIGFFKIRFFKNGFFKNMNFFKTAFFNKWLFAKKIFYFWFFGRQNQKSFRGQSFVPPGRHQKKGCAIFCIIYMYIFVWAWYAAPYVRNWTIAIAALFIAQAQRKKRTLITTAETDFDDHSSRHFSEQAQQF